MDIVIIEQTNNKVTLAIGLSKNKEQFKERIAKYDSNEKLFNSLKRTLDDKLDLELEKLTDLYFYGHLSEFSGYGKLLKPIRYSRDGKSAYYRDFTKTLEEQKEIMWLVNKCPDSKISYNILVSTLTKKNGIIATFTHKIN